MLKNLACIGGDERQKYMVSKLNENKFNVDLITKIYDNLSFYDAFILPLPVTKDNEHINSTEILFDDLIDKISSNQVVFTGKANDKIKMKFLSKNIKLYDYYEREEFALKNAIPTALGVLNFVMNNTTKIIPQMKILVIGYGKCARAITKVFNSLGANVISASRKYITVAEAQENSLNACLIKDMYKQVSDVDVIINTVPAPILDKTFVDLINNETLTIDIASAPYGFDYSYAKKTNKKIIILPSIPGLYFPKSAGYIIADTIMNIIEEGGL